MIQALFQLWDSKKVKKQSPGPLKVSDLRNWTSVGDIQMRHSIIKELMEGTITFPEFKKKCSSQNNK